MVTMHGFFDLKNESAEGEFKTAYEAFGKHLIKENRIIGYRVMRRKFHDGYDSRPPETRFYIGMDFADLEQANGCWDYIEERLADSHSLHVAVYAQITNASFFLSEDIPSE